METMHAAGRRSLPPVPRAGSERTEAERPRTDGPDAEGAEALAAEHLEPDLTAPAPAPDLADRADAESDGPINERLETDPATGPETEDQDSASTDRVRTGPDETGDGTADDGDGGARGSDTEDDDEAQTSAAQDSDGPGSDAPDFPAPDSDAHDSSADDSSADDSEPPQLDDAQEFVARIRAAAPDFASAAGALSAVVREVVPPARHRRSRCHVVLRYADGTQADTTFLGPAGRPGSPSRHGFDRQIRRWLEAGQRQEGAWLVPDPDAPDGTAIDLGVWVAAA
jgi:hypothetical protein